jgi:hypothetical protein
VKNLTRTGLAFALSFAGCAQQIVTGAPARTVPLGVGRADLLYVAGACYGTCILDYPSGSPVGGIRLNGNLCGNAKDGSIFIVPKGSRTISEYAHGHVHPIRMYRDPDSNAFACAVDPIGGRLAVTNYKTDVVVFDRGVKNPKVYSASWLIRYLYCTYDNLGNLFIVGRKINRHGPAQPVYAKLPANSNTFVQLTLSPSPNSQPSPIQWDGQYLAIGDTRNVAIDQYSLSGSVATQVGSTPLTGVIRFNQFAISGGTLVVPYGNGANPQVYSKLGFWSYPQGGTPTNVISDLPGARDLEAAVISLGT